MGDLRLASQCKLYVAFSLLQRGRLKQAAKIIRQVQFVAKTTFLIIKFRNIQVYSKISTQKQWHTTYVFLPSSRASFPEVRNLCVFKLNFPRWERMRNRIFVEVFLRNASCFVSVVT